MDVVTRAVIVLGGWFAVSRLVDCLRTGELRLEDETLDREEPVAMALAIGCLVAMVAIGAWIALDGRFGGPDGGGRLPIRHAAPQPGSPST